MLESEKKKMDTLERAAVNACVAHIKNHTGGNYMRKAVEEYFAFMVEPLTPNDLDKRETYLDHRMLAAQRLSIQCIGYLNHEQLSQLDRELRTLWKNPPEPEVSRKRGRGL